MKKILFTLVLLAFIGLSTTYAQVGIGTTNPKSTLDVVGDPADLTKTDGVIAPRLTGDELAAKNALYLADQTAALVYVTAAATAPTGKTANVTAAGYYFFDGSVWQKVAVPNAAADNTNDEWVNNPGASRVELAKNSDGTTRAAGTQFVALDNGNVGIGTATPTSQLMLLSGTGQTTANLDNTGNTQGILTLRSGGSPGSGGAVTFGGSFATSPLGFAAIKGLATNGSSNTTGDLAFSTRNAAADVAMTERMRITGAGNVGIGTDSPTRMLHVAGDARIEDLSGTGTRLVAAGNTGVLTEFTAGTAGQVIKWNGTAWAPANESADLWSTDGTNVWRPTANVGIGTATPVSKLHITGGSSTRDGGIAMGTAYAHYMYNANNSFVIDANGDVDFRIAQGTNNGSGNIVFQTAAGTASGGTGASTEKMRIDALGNVGIGTATPTYPLTVRNNTALGGTAGDEQDLLQLVGLNSNVGQLNFKQYRVVDGTGWTSAGMKIQRQIDNTPLSFIDYRAGSLVIGHNNTDNVMFSSNGLVGIGINVPTSKLHVAGDARIEDLSGTGTRLVTASSTGVLSDFASGTTAGQVIKWNGSAWAPAADANNTYTGSTSVTLSGTSFQRAALTGDVTAAANSNATTIANNAVTTVKIANNAVTSAKIADANVTMAKIAPSGATSGQVIKWNGSAWAPSADANTDLWSTNGTDVWRPSGNVGIGTATPTSQLSIVGGADQTTANLSNTGSTQGVLTLRSGGAGGSGGAVTFGGSFATSPLGFAAIKGLATNGGSNTTGDLAFSTRNAAADVAMTERMRITSAGNVGIGTSAPSDRLHVEGNAFVNGRGVIGQTRMQFGTIEVGELMSGDRTTFVDFQSSDPTDFDARIIRNPGVNGSFEIVNKGTGHMRIANGLSDIGIYILANDNVGIGTTTPTALLSVDGTANKPGGGTWGTFSDIRTKKEVQNFNDGLEVVMQLNPITFKYNEKSGYKDLEKEYIGFSAQDVEKVAPYMVNIIDDSEQSGLSDKRTLDVSAMTQIFVNAIQQQQAQIDALTAENEKLTAKVEAIDLLQARLSSLEEQLSGQSTQQATQKTASAE